MIDTGDAPTPQTSVRLRPGNILLWTAWFGLSGGTLELFVFLLKCNLLDPRNYNVGRHFVWMYPVAGIVVAAIPGLFLALAAVLRPGRLPASFVVGVLTFVTTLGVIFRAPISTVACLLAAGGLAVQAGRRIGPRALSFDRMVRRSLPALGILLAATVAGSFGRELWSDGRIGTGTPKRPAAGLNVVLIVLDTVRAESLSLNGYSRETSPNLSKWAKRGVRFDQAYSTAPWTAPSHAGMFTGRWAGENSIGWSQRLDGSSPTLAEVLGKSGYETAGFVANTTYCSYETGLDRGFVHYEDYDITPHAVVLCSALVQRTLTFIEKYPELARRIKGGESSSTFRKSADRINADFLSWESRRADPRRPFFAFLNYYDAHHPYITPEPWDDGPPGLRPESAADYGLLRSWWGMDKQGIAPRQVDLARDSYERCIAFLDGRIGRLFDELERRGLFRDTLVIITSDHGEHFGEQALYGHGVSLYRPELHVPLVLLGPEDLVPVGRVVDAPVSLRDLPATVLDRLGVAHEASPFPGRSLARMWSAVSGTETSEEPIRSEVQAPPEDDPNHGKSPARLGPMTSFVRGGLHYIRNGDGREELYDLTTDPKEEHDISTSPIHAAALREFRAWLRR